MKFGVLIGTRPGIVKMAPVFHAVRKAGYDPVLIHSGQHYSQIMDSRMMADVNLPDPDYRVFKPEDCKSHGEQTAFMLINIEKALMKAKPDFFFVCGDANTNLAGALASRKLDIPVGHVEAGLRSFDWRMPEEHNRRMIDHISDVLFCPTTECLKNLETESVVGASYVVGNTIADSILNVSNQEESLVGLDEILITLHRQENVDDINILRFLLSEIRQIVEYSCSAAVFFMHPRTLSLVEKYELSGLLGGDIEIRSPVSYREMVHRIKNAKFILTDSGGLQEEACILRTPCFTLRVSTERPETVACGANTILGIEQPFRNFYEAKDLILRDWDSPFGDGTAANKIVAHTINWLGSS